MEVLMAHKILVGCDPELFMFRAGRPVSAHGVIKGTKHEPFKVQHGAVQVDGTALEFNIDPAENLGDWMFNIDAVMDQLRKMVPDDADILAEPVAEYGFEYMKTLPREAVELGCEPDFNAWENGAVNEKPDVDAPFRTGSGHVHIGWTDGASIYDITHSDSCILATKQLDFSLGLGSLLFDKDVKRRVLYGSAGSFRPKSYGVEYRVLSNAWLRSSKLMEWVFNTTQKAIGDLMDGKYYGNEIKDLDVRELIKNGQGNMSDSSIENVLRVLGIEAPVLSNNLATAA
jgi:hypothetical protein